MIDPDTKEEILNRTLEAVHLRRTQRERRLKNLASSSILFLVGGLGIGLGLLVGNGPGEGRHPGATVRELPPRMGHGLIRTAAVEEVADTWDPPSTLVLVVNESGMEIKPLNTAQISALARKPGCEFAFTPDAVMRVSEASVEGDAFSPPLVF